MKLGLTLETLDFSTQHKLDLAVYADDIGVDSVWVAEAYGCDGVSPLGALAARTSRIMLGTAILQIHARTAVATAMAAMTVDRLSNGRFTLGLGTSGPQVTAGWYGLDPARPLELMREYVSVVRQVLRRETVRHDGERIRIPSVPEVRTLKLMSPPLRPDIPIALAALGPRSVQQALEIGDAWLPIWFSPAKAREIYGHLAFPAGFEIAPLVNVVMGKDTTACRNAVKPKLAHYVGGMGSRKANYYKNLVSSYGYADAAEKIQELYLAGRKPEAAQLVPDSLVDDVALCGPEGRIKDLLVRWEAAGVTSIIACTDNYETIHALRRLVA